jgi:hypothetical protein
MWLKWVNGVSFGNYCSPLCSTDRVQRTILAVPRAKLGGSKSQPVLCNYTTDEGRPLEPTCRSRTQTTFRCCVLRDVVVNGEGKGPIRLGQVTSRKGDRKGTTVLVSKRVR